MRKRLHCAGKIKRSSMVMRSKNVSAPVNWYPLHLATPPNDHERERAIGHQNENVSTPLPLWPRRRAAKTHIWQRVVVQGQSTTILWFAQVERLAGNHWRYSWATVEQWQWRALCARNVITPRFLNIFTTNRFGQNASAGSPFLFFFDSRKYFRKEVKLPGEYWDTSGGQDLMTVTTLSICGAGFEARRGNLLVREGETIQIKFLPNSNDRNWIKLKAVVKRVKGNQIGVEFTELNDHQRKCIGFYLMPWSEYDCVKLNPPLPFPETLPVTLLSLLRPWRPSTTFCARFFEGEVWIKGVTVEKVPWCELQSILNFLPAELWHQISNLMINQL